MWFFRLFVLFCFSVSGVASVCDRHGSHVPAKGSGPEDTGPSHRHATRLERLRAPYIHSYIYTYIRININLLFVPLPTGGSITFKDVHFSYPSNPDRKILNGLSLHVPAGKKVAIVGSSGSGKSTIYRLLYRFYDADSGQVLVDQQDVRNITLPSLRSVRATHINLPYGACLMLIISLVLFGFRSW